MEKKAAKQTAKTWESRIRDQISHYKRVARQKKFKENFVESLDFSPDMANRRSRAILNTMEMIYARYPAMAELEKDTLGIEWLNLNLPFQTYSRIESRSHLLFGAALWILDNLWKEEEKRNALLQILPEDDRILDEIDSPDVWDCQYDYDLISSVQYVLHARNEDAMPIEIDGEGNQCVLTDLLCATGKQHTDTPSRKRFEQLLALIPPDAIEAAVARFESLFWDWSDRYFRCITPLCKEIAALEKELESEFLRFKGKKERFNRDAKAKVKKKIHQLKRLNSAPNLLLAKPEVPQSALPKSPVQKNLDHGIPEELMTDPEFLQLKALSEELDGLEKKMKDMDSRMHKLVFQRSNLTMAVVSGGILRGGGEEFETKAEEYWGDFSIPDPYELCFALLYLIEQDSDLPWLYGIGCGLMEVAADSLPWGILEYDEEDDIIWGGEAEAVQKPVELPDWYERKYSRRHGELKLDRSLAQILYEETGCILPRNLHLYDNRMKELRKYGVRGTRAITMLTCMTALSHARRLVPAPNFEQDEFLRSEWEAEAAERDAESTEKIRALQEEVRRLRSALHSAEKSSHEAEKELENAKAQAELERRELADLREFVFNQEVTEEQEEETVPDNFPYFVKQNTVVFGGHKTWDKVIRPLFAGNIRFIDKDLIFDINIIRHADMLWIQPNALSHKQYYRIIDVARRYQKPVRYFTNASAMNCAEKIVENDRFA